MGLTSFPWARRSPYLGEFLNKLECLPSSELSELTSKAVCIWLGDPDTGDLDFEVMTVVDEVDFGVSATDLASLVSFLALMRPTVSSIMTSNKWPQIASTDFSGIGNAFEDSNEGGLELNEDVKSSE